MADKPHEYECQRPKREKKPSKYALSLVGEAGEFSFPKGYQDLDGVEMKIREVLPGGKYRVSVEWNHGSWKRGDELIVERDEFVTHAQKKWWARTRLTREDLDGVEMKVRDMLPSDKYRISVEWNHGRHEFVTHAQKK